MKQRCVSNDFIVNNDNCQRFPRRFYIKQKEGEREQDSKETERENVGKAEHGRREKIASAIK